MSVLLDLLYFRFKRYLPMIYGVLLFVIAVVICYYVYAYIYVPTKETKPYQDVANSNPTGRVISIFLYTVDWCPHCKKAAPEWKMFSDQYNNTSLNGYQIDCRVVDCTNTDDPTVKSLIAKYDIKQYPTVIATVPGANGKETRVDYDASVKKQYLDKFVMSLTTENSGM